MVLAIDFHNTHQSLFAINGQAACQLRDVNVHVNRRLHSIKVIPKPHHSKWILSRISPSCSLITQVCLSCHPYWLLYRESS